MHTLTSLVRVGSLAPEKIHVQCVDGGSGSTKEGDSLSL